VILFDTQVLFMQNKPNRGFRRLVRATRYSWQGFYSAFCSEAAFREELVLCLIMIPITFFLDVSLIERLLMILSLLLILVVELLNSAIEAVVDRIGFERHELAGQAKDMGSAAVLVTILMAVLTWGGILCF
jgi:diacylglycerol kinase (ATP)